MVGPISFITKEAARTSPPLAWSRMTLATAGASRRSISLTVSPSAGEVARLAAQSAVQRFRHLRIVSGLTPTSCATTPTVAPFSSSPNTCARIASQCFWDRRPAGLRAMAPSVSTPLVCPPNGRGSASLQTLPAILYHPVSSVLGKKPANCWLFMVAKLGDFAPVREKGVRERRADRRDAEPQSIADPAQRGGPLWMDQQPHPCDSTGQGGLPSWHTCGTMRVSGSEADDRHPRG